VRQNQCLLPSRNISTASLHLLVAKLRAGVIASIGAEARHSLGKTNGPFYFKDVNRSTSSRLSGE
jgi:hypothetical protein